MKEQSDMPRTDAAKDQMVRVPMKFINKIARERDEALAALRMIADGDLYNADGMRTIARKALAATEPKP